MTSSEMIYAHARNFTSGFLLLLKLPLNVSLHVKCSRRLGIGGGVKHLRPKIELYLIHLVRMRRHNRHKSYRKWRRAGNDRVFIRNGALNSSITQISKRK